MREGSAVVHSEHLHREYAMLSRDHAGTESTHSQYLKHLMAPGTLHILVLGIRLVEIQLNALCFSLSTYSYKIMHELARATRIHDVHM